MTKRTLRSPFFTINPKSYLYGVELLKLALVADELAEKYDIDILFTAQLVDMRLLASHTKHLILTAQHLDSHTVGKGMGLVLGEALIESGVRATFLNHAEHPMTLSNLARSVARAKELGIITITCADSVSEAMAIAQLAPDVMVCEPTELIGTGKSSDANYMEATNRAVKQVSASTLVLQAAGISSGKNVYDAIMSGADGTGGTSGIVCAADPAETLREMMEALVKAKKDQENK